MDYTPAVYKAAGEAYCVVYNIYVTFTHDSRRANLLLHRFGVSLPLLPPFVDPKQWSHVVHPLNETGASPQWDDCIVLRLVQLRLVSVGGELYTQQIFYRTLGSKDIIMSTKTRETCCEPHNLCLR